MPAHRSLALLSLTVALMGSPLTAQHPTPSGLEETTIARIHARFRAHRLSCREVVVHYLDRIAAYDKMGPSLNALIVVNPHARAIADSLDRRFAHGGLVGPLHCIPVIVKDNFETNDLQTTAGSLALAGWIPRQDATMVRRIRDAGAIVLAKSNMAEWAFTPYETVSSILPGYTKNPYALDRVTAGSSGGTGAGVAAEFGEVGLGTDTGNSIRGPSAHNALVGIRSTMGLTSRAGVVPLSNWADIAGPMARTVSDAAALFQVVAGEDADDPVTAPSRGHREADYRTFIVPGGLKGARIGVLRQAYEQPSVDSEVVAVFARAIDAMRAQGAIIVDPASVDSFDVILKSVDWECNPFKFDLERYFAARGSNAPVKTVDEILKSGKFHPSVELRLQVAKAATLAPEANPACIKLDTVRARLGKAVSMMMDANTLDALVYPTWSYPPRLIGDLNTPHGDNSQIFSPVTGFPAITVPMGYTRHNTLPAGMTLFGRPWSEGKLITLAYGFEQATHHRRRPPSTPPLR